MAVVVSVIVAARLSWLAAGALLIVVVELLSVTGGHLLWQAANKPAAHVIIQIFKNFMVRLLWLIIYYKICAVEITKPYAIDLQIIMPLADSLCHFGHNH